MVVRADALVVAILVRNHSVRNFENEFWLLFRKLLERCNRAVVRPCQVCDAGLKSQNGGVQGAAVLTTIGLYVASVIYVFVLSGTG